MGWKDQLLNTKPGTVGRAFSKGPHGHGSMPHLSTHNKGGRVGLKSGTSSAMMRRLEDRIEDKKKYRELRKAKKESRAENVKSIHPPAHPLSVRGSTEALLGKGNIQEKIIKFGEKFDKKQAEKRKLKKDTKEMKNRAKKLTAYEGTT